MSSANNSGIAEFPFDKQTVFKALLRAIHTIDGMSVRSSDLLSGRVVVKSLLSSGENIPITLMETSPDKTRVQIDSTVRTGVSQGGFSSGDGGSGDTSFLRNRKNVERIFSALALQLSRVAQAPGVQKKQCPICAELIQAEAVRCRFCGADWAPSPSSEQTSRAPVVNSTPQPIGEFFDEHPKPKFIELKDGAILFECGLCGQQLEVDASGAGVEIKCPECGENQVVPAA